MCVVCVVVHSVWGVCASEWCLYVCVVLMYMYLCIVCVVSALCVYWMNVKHCVWASLSECKWRVWLLCT